MASMKPILKNLKKSFQQRFMSGPGLFFLVKEHNIVRGAPGPSSLLYIPFPRYESLCNSYNVHFTRIRQYLIVHNMNVLV